MENKNIQMEGTLYGLALIGSFIVLGSAQIPSFCHIQSCGDRPHTLCLYPFVTPSPTCGKVISSGLTQQEVNQILDLHNKYRKRVADGQEDRGNPGPQPPAKYMPDLTWSNDLAAVAQTWADQCTNHHDACRNLPKYAVGQNMNWLATPEEMDMPLSILIDTWYDEVDDVNKDIVRSYVDIDVYNHYTQMVWAKTTEIGCGLIRYIRTGQDNKETFLVCNYGPVGNMKGEPVYQVAE